MLDFDPAHLYPLAATGAAYLIGSVSFAVVVSRFMGLADPRSYGSNNPGATNVLRSGNKLAAVLTLLLDAAKGWLPVWAVVHEGAALGLGEGTVAMVALAAFVGHVWPVFFRFKGGKGVATASGAMLVVHPFISLGLLLLWAVLSKTTKKASVSSLIITVLLPVCIALTGKPGWEVGATIGIGVLVVIRHIPNLRRLRSGLEPSLPSKPT